MRPLLRAVRPPQPIAARHRLIITEQGACGVEAFLSADEVDETVVVPQGVLEPPVEFLFRVMGRLALVERSGGTFDRAAILVAPERSGQSLVARELVARVVLAHLAKAGRGEIVLAASEADTELRHDVLTLVDKLLTEHEGTPVTLRLRFRDSEAPPASRVRAARRPVEELAS
jgi:hypothetical protein